MKKRMFRLTLVVMLLAVFLVPTLTVSRLDLTVFSMGKMSAMKDKVK